MFVKRFLIFFPLVLIIFLAQSFFWVPTYDKQAVGNPERLKKYIRGSAADAEILNPTISADTTSSSMNDLIFDGLISLDDKLEYRPRLATSWTQTEEAFLVVDPRYRLNGIESPSPDSADWVNYLKTSLKGNQQWITNIKTVEPGQLLDIEDRTSQGNPVESQALYHLVECELLATIGHRPAHHGQIVQHRLRQKTHGFVESDAGRVLALAELALIRVTQERHMNQPRHIPAKIFIQQHMFRS